MMSVICTLVTLAASTPVGGGRWRPLLDPLPMDQYYLVFLVPLVVVIAIVYKTIKMEDLTRLPRAAAILSGQILVFLALAAVALWLLTELS